MVIIDNISDEVFICSITDVGRIVGRTRQTISNWSKKGNKITYNNWSIYFKARTIKQKKGFAI